MLALDHPYLLSGIHRKICWSKSTSIGLATILPEDLFYEDTLKRADRALYEAKGKGKNRVAFA